MGFAVPHASESTIAAPAGALSSDSVCPSGRERLGWLESKEYKAASIVEPAISLKGTQALLGTEFCESASLPAFFDTAGFELEPVLDGVAENAASASELLVLVVRLWNRL